MNDPATHPVDEHQLEELVAYLDGELDESGVQQVERRLSEDAGYRRQLNQLQRAWDLLDELPTTDVDDVFARSTVEMVAVSAHESAVQQQVIERQWTSWMWICGSTAIILALLVGYLLMADLGSSPPRDLVDNLPLIEHQQLFTYADSAEFLRGLHEAELFGDALEEPEGQLARQENTVDRRQRLIAMSPGDRLELQRRKAAFDRIPDANRQRMQKLHQQLITAQDAAALELVLLDYVQWLQTLPEATRERLLALTTSERLAEVRRLITTQRHARLTKLADQTLSRDDTRKIYGWLKTFVVDHEDEILRGAPPELARRLDYIERARQRGISQAPERSRLLITALRRMNLVRLIPSPSAEETADLQNRLSPRARQFLATVRPQDRPQAVSRWLRAALMSNGPVSRIELQRFLQNVLTSEQRERLARLPSDRFNIELERLYTKHFQSDAVND